MAKTPGKVIINFEATEKEREYIRHMAQLHGLPMATYIRMRAMNPIEEES